MTYFFNQHTPIITADSNATIKHITALAQNHRHRKKHGESILEGVHLLQAYLERGLIPKTVIIGQNALADPQVNAILSQLDTKNNARPCVFIVSDALYKRTRTLGKSLAIMAVIDMPNLTLDSPIDKDCLIVDGVQDNGNLGTLLRSAAAVGIDTVICTPTTAQAYAPKTLRAGMGAHFSLDIYENIQSNAIIHALQIPLFATSSHSDNIIYQCDLRKPLAFVMGNEGQGVSDDFMTHARPLTLPQCTQESLNVAVAGSLCLYEMLRQRKFTHN